MCEREREREREMASEKDVLCDKLCSMMMEKRSKCMEIMTFCMFFGLAEGVIDNAAHGDAPMRDTDRDAAEVEARDKVGRPINRIENPRPLRHK